MIETTPSSTPDSELDQARESAQPSIDHEALAQKTDEQPDRQKSPSVQQVQEAPVSHNERIEYRSGRSDGLVGIFALLALGLLFGGYCWWKSYTPLNPPQRFYVVFHDVASLNQQAPVFVHGVYVGSVEDIKIRSAEDDVLVKLKVNTQKCKIPVGSRFIILPNGVVGAKYVEIIMPQNFAGPGQQTAWLTEKSVVQGDDPLRPEIVVNQLVEKLGAIDFEGIQNKLVQSMNKMSSLADAMMPVAAHATATAESVTALAKKMMPVAAHATATADSVTALAQQMRGPVTQMHQILDQKHPLMHMMLGRPGHLKAQDEKGETQSSAGKVTIETKSSKSLADNADSTAPKPKKKHHHFLGL